ncbi:MAG: hypothetical protein RAP70_05950 [Candidatus Celaenobacter antarcticus]|nr:hypothetical protein [Candidatus Celaenobacter antarcticus]
MKYKIFLLVILLILIAYINADAQEHFGLFTTFNPSAETIAFGNESGTAYIWGNNPLNSWSNPALLAYSSGLSWGWSHDPWLEGFVDGIYMNSSYVSYANQNFGLLLPMLNASTDWGTTLDYGETEIYNAEGHLIGHYRSREISTRFGIGCKILKTILKNRLSNLSDKMEISLGYDLRYIVSNIPPMILKTSPPDGTGFMHGIGFLGHIRPLQFIPNVNHAIKMDITAGLYKMNVTKNDLSCFDYTYPLLYGTRGGFAAKLSYGFLGDKLQGFMPFYGMKNNVSICFIYDTAKYETRSSTWGQGFEFGLFETLFLRWGNYHNASEQERNTFGVGVKLNFSSIHFEYNYATFSIGSLDTTERKDDLMISVDLMKVLGKK